MSNQSTNNNGEKKRGKTDPIDKPGEVQKSNDENIDRDFPGYPHYPAREDIMQPGNHTERVTADVDGVSKADINYMHLDNPTKTTAQPADPTRIEDQEDLGIVEGTEADVTDDDLEVLGAVDRDMDMNEDERRLDDDFKVAHDTDEVEAVDEHLNKVHDAELDVPGEELDDNNEGIGEEDEENNYYSLGGDEKD
ncbi:MAG: hypothetical protein JWN76_3368 [Chitinophagaceae bacterium]|nr:hypothetical protein [Chitinophagaceae bacterium]